LGASGSPVDARRYDTLDSVRHHDVLESLRQHPGVTDATDTARLAKRLDHFFDKERVALGLACEQGLKIVGQTLGDEHRARHRDAFLGRQSTSHEAGLIAPLAEGVRVPCSIGQDDEDATRGKTIRDERQVFFRRLVRPVDVFVDDHLRMDLRGLEEEATQGVEQLAPTLLGIHARHGRIAGVDADEVADIRNDRPQIFAERENSILKPANHCFFVIALLDTEPSAERIDQRMEGDRLTERDATSFLPCCAVTDLLTELV
jgi:hypothetical protein